MKTYYTIHLLNYSPAYRADMTSQLSLIHKRDDLTEAGLLRILKRDHPDRVDSETRIERVERMVYAGNGH